MQKKYPTNFLDPLDISEYNSNSTKDFARLRYRPASRLHLLADFFSHYVTRCSLFYQHCHHCPEPQCRETAAPEYVWLDQ